MIDISGRAQRHFRHLLDQQGVEDMSIRLRVIAPGTAAAHCELEFCEMPELDGSEWKIECVGFDFYLEGTSADWLHEASIDYEPNRTGGQINIHAPKIKGARPKTGADLVERVRDVLESDINPRLASHGGRVALVEVNPDGMVVLRFGGGCQGCGMIDLTLKQGVEKNLRERVPEITAVRDITDHASGRQPYYRHGE